MIWARSPFSTVGEHKDLLPVQIAWGAYRDGKLFQVIINPIDPNQTFTIPEYLECLDILLREIRKDYAEQIADFYANRSSEKIIPFPRGVK